MLIRKSFGFGPLRLTFSRKGLSESVGGQFLRVTRGGSGSRFAFRIPGTGLSLRRRIKR